MKILTCWIGKSDLTASAGGDERNLGPVAQAAATERFDELHLLNNFPPESVSPYLEWLKGRYGGRISATHTNLTSPTNYGEIYAFCREIVKNLVDEHPNDEITFHLSPGTPAMALVWMLLSARHGIRLIESSMESGVREVHLPFEISAYFLPDGKIREMADAGFLGNGAFSGIIGKSPKLLEAIRDAANVAPRNVAVLIEGESGTGKELFARAIHNASQRTGKPFVAVNCGAIPRELVEAHLFGARKGSYTNAVRDTPGSFRAASGGTLFLDEVGELPFEAQVKLLRALQEGMITVVGDSAETPVDVRIVAATNRNLMSEVAAGRFREDLFFRLAVGIVRLPSLRERGDDASLLLDWALKDVNARFGLNGKAMKKRLSPDARKIFLRHVWPGNVRELYNTVARAAMWAGGDVIDGAIAQRSLLVFDRGGREMHDMEIGNGFSLPAVMEEIERHYVEKAWKESGFRKNRGAELLGYPNYQTFDQRLRKFNII